MCSVKSTVYFYLFSLDLACVNFCVDDKVELVQNFFLLPKGSLVLWNKY